MQLISLNFLMYISMVPSIAGGGGGIQKHQIVNQLTIDDSADDKIFLALATDVEKFQAGSVKSKVFLLGDINHHHASWLGSTDVCGKAKTNSAAVACFTLCQTICLRNVIKGKPT